MLFNSVQFAIFLVAVFFLYWGAKDKLKLQNFILLASSYYFYSCWDYRFLFLLIFSTFLDYFTGLKIHQAQSKKTRKTWLAISVIINLGFLGAFKYYNFFAANFSSLLDTVGMHTDPWTLNVILPVGISFYTFHGLSYVFDIYNDKITPRKNFIDYSVFVSFFPLLVAGPIERATHLLPQVEAPRKFDYAKAVDGMRQILWGLFKKVVIADNCAEIVNMIFSNHTAYSGSTLLLGAVLFAFQIYGDFSGYSDIALGTARLFGFELLRNFSYPYFSRDIAEFWRRWHISLSSWFRDYLYYPLGGSRVNKIKRIRNTFIIFLVSGFWHGANWTFIVWGGLNAAYFLPLLITDKNRNNLEIAAKGHKLPSLSEIFQIVTTFILTVFAWIFFRSASVSQALSYIKKIFSKSLFEAPKTISAQAPYLYVLIILLMVIEWMQREKKHGLEMHSMARLPIRWSVYVTMIIVIFRFGFFKETQFIYFQF
jgi:alginate O-acetyltransferase complex protein AlgI